MNTLREWAVKWGVSLPAVEDLESIFGIDNNLDLKTGASEASVQARVRLDAANKGVILWRNNSGAFYSDSGALVRYGLCNDSKALNANVKSSDLIGIEPVIITLDMVGSVIGRFVARECKEEGWTYKGTKREQAQRRFLEIVTKHGGSASFCSRGTYDN